jgi:hypothetical protein
MIKFMMGRIDDKVCAFFKLLVEGWGGVDEFFVDF